MNDDPARARYFVIQALRWSGLAIVVVALMIIEDKIDLPKEAGYVLFVVGLLDVSLFLSGGAFRRRNSDGERRGISSPAVSEWALVDESPDGYGIRYLRGDIGNVEVGDIVGIRPRESSHVQICLVRRVSNAGQTRFELGLQNLSPHALVVDLPARAGAVRAKAVLLPRLPAFNNAAGLLSTPGSVPEGLEILYPTAGTRIRLKLAQRLEGNSRNEFHLLLPA